MNVKLKNCVLAIVVLGFCSQAKIFAGLLETQSNLVPNSFGNGSDWYTLSSWETIGAYSPDSSGDGSPSDGFDWFYTQVAHDDFYFYLHYHNSHDFAGDRQLTYFDTDLDSNTGLPGFSGNLAIGAEYYLSGASLNQDGVGHLGFISWIQSQDGSGEWDIFVAIDRATYMPGVTSFNFVNQNHDSGGDDWYPDAANSGAKGDYFRYQVVPEPTSLAVVLLSLVCVSPRFQIRKILP